MRRSPQPFNGYDDGDSGFVSSFGVSVSLDSTGRSIMCDAVFTLHAHLQLLFYFIFIFRGRVGFFTCSCS